MSTFLALCQQLHSDVGTAGSMTKVSDQTGELKRIVDYIVKANRKIQRRKTNWKFLWAEWDYTIVLDTSEFSGPDGLGAFDQESFWVNSGATDARHLTFIDHKEWRDIYRQGYIDSGESSFITIKPNGKLAILPSPDSDDAGSAITCDYWKAPVELVNNGDISLIPSQFHEAIISQAKMYYAIKKHNTGLYNAAFIEHEAIYRELKAYSLPGQEEERKSEASKVMYATVV